MGDREDPLMPAGRRFPRDAYPLPTNDESPSTARPFVLRLAGIGGVVREGKHRTPATKQPMQPVPMTTTDGNQPRQVPDPTYVPDD